MLTCSKHSTRKLYLQMKIVSIMNLRWLLCDGTDERTECTQVEIAEQTLHLGTQHAIEVFNMMCKIEPS